MKKVRYHLLDGIRGLALLSMVSYHGMYDLVELFHVPVDWFWKTPGYLWQQGSCWTFIILSGFCWSLGKSPLRRGLTVFGWGVVITIVTSLFLPSERILFGILTLIGTAMVLMIPLSKICDKIPGFIGILLCAGLFFVTRNINHHSFGFGPLVLGSVPAGLYRGIGMTFLVFPVPGFYSSDYFSLFPWLFLYLCGYFLYKMIIPYETIRTWLQCPVGIFSILGRYSLVIYLLHQPLLMGILDVFFN